MTEASNIRQQIGEILATVRALDERMRERQTEARESERRLNEEIRNVKHETRNQMQIVTARAELADTKLTKLEIAVVDVSHELAKVREEQARLRGPVDQLVNLKRRIGALGVLSVSIGAFVWAVFEPVYRLLVERFMAK